MQKLKVEYVIFVRGTYRSFLTILFLLDKCIFIYRGIILEKMIEYMSFKTHYDSTAMSSKEEIPAVNDFMERIPPEIVLELLVLILPSKIFILSNRHFFLDLQQQIIKRVS